MKNRKIIIPLAVILVLSITAGLAVYAVLSVPEEQPVAATEPVVELTTEPVAEPVTLSLADVDHADIYAREKTVVDESVQQKKVCTVEGRTAPLNYAQSYLKNSGQQVDVFKDEYGNEYEYDTEGYLVGYSNDGYDKMYGSFTPEGRGITTKITQEEAIAIADQAGRALFGERFDLVEFEDVYQADDGMCYVDYSQKLGKDGFIKGIFAYAMIQSDGTIYSIGIPNYNDLKDFDASRLDGFTKEAIESELEAKARAIHGDNFISCEIDPPSLKVVDGRCVLECGVMSQIKSGKHEFADGGQVYYYKIP